MEYICDKVLCRESQLTELLNLIGESDEPLPYSLFISGNTATGKTLCVESVLRYLGYKHVFINCVECYSVKIMCEMIVSGLVSDENEDITSERCDSLKDFVAALNSLQNQYNRYEPMVIVFDKAERLRTMDSAIMCTFLRLKELCKLNICTIFITELIYENFYFNMGLREPTKIYFPNYNKQELYNIIFLSQKTFVQYVVNTYDVDEQILQELENPKLFADFLNAFLSVFYRPCRDLIELRYMARENFIKYCEPIAKHEIKSTDLTKLWRYISPIFKTSLEHVYLRINTNATIVLSPGKENKLTNSSNTHHNLENTLKEELKSTKVFAQSFELPYYAKYLLIAAYLASYNPLKEDKRLFMKNHGKQRKRMQQVKAKAKIAEKLNTQLGPKMFTLDRWLAIFYAILEDKIGLNSKLLSQVVTLVELKLISGSKEIDLDSSKYKCIVGYDFISAVAGTVGFNIRKYLYDFL